MTTILLLTLAVFYFASSKKETSSSSSSSSSSFSASFSAETEAEEVNLCLRGPFNGTYLEKSGSGRFAIESASKSTSSVAYRIARSEYKLKVRCKIEVLYNGKRRPHFLFKWRSRTAKKYYYFSFFNGQPFDLEVVENGQKRTTRKVTIFLQKQGDWEEFYEGGGRGTPVLAVRREFITDPERGEGVILSVTYKSAGVVYDKTFNKVGR